MLHIFVCIVQFLDWYRHSTEQLDKDSQVLRQNPLKTI